MGDYMDVDVLYILVGSNALVNYELLGYLLNPKRPDIDKLPVPNDVVLVSSNATSRIAEEVMDELSKEQNNVELPTFKNCILRDPSNPEKDMSREPDVINKTITDSIDELIRKGVSSIHLNFTGGTKPMAIYSMKVLSEKATEHGIRLISSDIDHFKLHVQDGKSLYLTPPGAEDMRNYVSTTIDVLVKLHNNGHVSQKKKQRSQPKLDIYRAAQEILGVYKEKKSSRDYGYRPDVFKELSDLKNNLNKGNVSPEDISNGLSKIKTHFPYVYNSISYPPGIRDLKDLLDFLDGLWLEDLVYSAIDDSRETLRKKGCHITDLIRSLKVKFDVNGRQFRDMEMDVVAVRGFQAYLFSCSTVMGIKHAKQKCFEAYYRSNQIGGQIARPIFVSTMSVSSRGQNTINALNNDLKSFVNIQKKVRLLSLMEFYNDNKFDSEGFKKEIVRILTAP